ncbi:MAG TPA: hypothetical protein IAD19_01340 [Candidatus Egerieicola faecale]|uniref:Uncharacterized protein n=1 Tax=Candidatus Egerieicola faecale TaxID=2840774 RepID=A0A9D1IQ06_9FIRM|nr:hypothetical protein [Candidatus Egerieicola faecale]
MAVLLSRFHPVGVFSKNTGVTKTLAKIYLDFSPECDIMIAKGNHYSSRLAAQKARAAFRLTAKTGGNSMGILWYNDCQRQLLSFPLCHKKARAVFRPTAKTSGTPTDAYGIRIAKARFLPVFAKQSCIHAL